jgi:hypothetical protein
MEKMFKKIVHLVVEDGDGIPKGYFVIKIHKGSRYEVEKQLTSLSLFIIDKGTVCIESSLCRRGR